MKYPPIFDYIYLFIAVFIFSDILIFKSSVSENQILLFWYSFPVYVFSEDITEKI